MSRVTYIGPANSIVVSSLAAKFHCEIGPKLAALRRPLSVNDWDDGAAEAFKCRFIKTKDEESFRGYRNLGRGDKVRGGRRGESEAPEIGQIANGKDDSVAKLSGCA